MMFALAGSASAISFQECILADGSKIFTDQPCPKNAKELPRFIADPKPPPPPPADPVDTAAPPTEVANTDEETRKNAPPPVPKPRKRYRCIRPEGGDYVSNTTHDETRWVPLWKVERPNLILDSGGADVQAAKRPPVASAKPNPEKAEASSRLVLVRDQCLLVTGSELCTMIRTERRQVEEKLAAASESQRPQLEAEGNQLDLEFVASCKTQTP
ncbi:hypothetical protein C7S18_12890 [Ahniella affigens]|uniref:DUF4124 domain-containing protein n=2 Tax=Ahniella affigens TaxID=2021234 RepID=A0A2P1PT97_9GAMM|nr:hypothetical protein C7S18_12890 [Ahniella affigens]